MYYSTQTPINIDKCHFEPFKNGCPKISHYFTIVLNHSSNLHAKMEQYFWDRIEQQFYPLPPFIKNAIK